LIILLFILGAWDGNDKKNPAVAGFKSKGGNAHD
jgi:hypothetical protein